MFLFTSEVTSEGFTIVCQWRPWKACRDFFHCDPPGGGMDWESLFLHQVSEDQTSHQSACRSH